MDDRDIDSSRLQVQTQALEERGNRSFAGAVSSRSWQTAVSGQTRYRHQLAASPRNHLRNDSRHAVRGPDDVDVKDIGNFLSAEVRGISGRSDAGIGDKYVDRAKAGA